MKLTADHEEHVAQMVIKIGKQMGLPSDHIGELQLAALVHDIGKVGIPPEILNKPGRLTDQEYAVIKSHSILGWRIVGWSGLSHVATWVRAHHERWDGTGYPDGLVGEEIPLGSRIIFVADTFDALTANRPYRRARTSLEAMEEIKRCSGTQFDPDVVAAFEVVVELNPAMTRPRGVRVMDVEVRHGGIDVQVHDGEGD